MAARSRHSYLRSREHRTFDGQPSIELATGASVRTHEEGDEIVVELLDVSGWIEIKRWSP